MTESQWLVRYTPSLEEVLAMVRNRDNPDYAINASVWFDNETDAAAFQLTESLRTGKTYKLIHKDKLVNGSEIKITKILGDAGVGRVRF